MSATQRTPARPPARRAPGAGRDWLAEARRAARSPIPMPWCSPPWTRRARLRAGRAVQGDSAVPGYVTFFTNYLSRKGLELAANPRAAAVMYWDRCTGRCASRARYAHHRGRQRRLFRLAPLAQPHRRLGQRPERPDRLARRAGRRGRRPARRFGAPSPLASADDARIPACRSRARRTGAAITCGRRPWSFGSKAPARLHDRARWTRSLQPTAAGFEGGPLERDAAASLAGC